MRHNIRQVENILENDDDVYYKRKNCNKWKGPGKVIGQDGKVVLIKHDIYTIRAHSSRVRKTTYEFVSKNPCDTTNKINADTVKDTIIDIPWEDDEDGDVIQEKSSASYEKESNSPEENSENSISNVNLPKKGDIIQYIPVNEENWRKATILGRAGKSTGIKKYWLNIQHIDDDDKSFSIDWKNGVKDWKSATPDQISNEAEDVFIIEGRHSEKKVEEAKKEELDKWKKYKVYDEVSDNGQPNISTRWVCNEKFSEDGSSRVKARLVAHGFEKNKNWTGDGQ